MTPTTSKDTLIDFPCYFPIKIIGNNTPSFLQEIEAITTRHFADFTMEDVRTKSSKNDNYLAITVTVFAMDKATLDAFYTAVYKAPGVKMVL